MKKLSIIIATIAVSVVAVSYATFALRPVTVPSTHVTAQVLKAPTQQELLDAVNAERVKAGVAPLVMDERLNQSAQYKADDMVKTGMMSHVDSRGKHVYQYIADYTSQCKTASENLSWSNDKSPSTLSNAMRSWIESKAHYEAMISDSYTITGFGIHDYVVVEHFC